MNLSDRRNASRFNVAIPFQFRSWNSKEPEMVAESINISKSGIYFESDSVLLIGTELRLKLEMPEEVSGVPREKWNCVGHIVRLQAAEFDQERIGVAVCIDYFDSVKNETEKEESAEGGAAKAKPDISESCFREDLESELLESEVFNTTSYQIHMALSGAFQVLISKSKTVDQGNPVSKSYWGKWLCRVTLD